MTTVAVPHPDVVLRRGPSYWWGSYLAMLRWYAVSLRTWLALLMVVQVFAGVGFVLGIALFFANVPSSAALFVSTGVPVTNLVLVGLILGPQLVADQKAKGNFDYLLALPVRQSAAALAWFTVTLVASLPAVVIALVVATLRYNLHLRVSPAVVPAVVLTALCGTTLGLALGYAVERPMAIRLSTQLLNFVVFGFAPVLYPPQQLPGWLAAVNWWLPFRHMANVVRGSLTDGVVTGVTASYLVIAVWTVACTGIVAVVLGRRR